MNKMQMMAVGALLAAGTALGGVRTNDYAWVRGTHYGPAAIPSSSSASWATVGAWG